MRGGAVALAEPYAVGAVLVVAEARGERRGSRVVVADIRGGEFVAQAGAAGEEFLVELPDVVEVAFVFSFERVDCAWDGEELVVYLEAELDGKGEEAVVLGCGFWMFLFRLCCGCGCGSAFNGCFRERLPGEIFHGYFFRGVSGRLFNGAVGGWFLDNFYSPSFCRWRLLGKRLLGKRLLEKGFLGKRFLR